jgi:hypothetical protein
LDRRVVVMTCTVMLDDASSPAERRSRVEAVAAALRAADAETVLVDWVADGLLGWANVDPRRLVLAVRYKAALDDALSAAAGSVDWEPGGDPEPDRAVYRLAASLGVSAAVERVVLASLDPQTYLDRDPYADDGPLLPVRACYAGLVDAGLLIGVDWKSTRTEAAEAFGGLLIVPDNGQRFADAVPGFADLLRRCAAADRADLDGRPGLPADDPLRADREQPEAAVARDAARLAGAAGIALLRLDNGDTPGYLACRDTSVADLLRLASAAAAPVEQVC